MGWPKDVHDLSDPSNNYFHMARNLFNPQYQKTIFAKLVIKWRGGKESEHVLLQTSTLQIRFYYRQPKILVKEEKLKPVKINELLDIKSLDPDSMYFNSMNKPIPLNHNISVHLIDFSIRVTR